MRSISLGRSKQQSGQKNAGDVGGRTKVIEIVALNSYLIDEKTALSSASLGAPSLILTSLAGHFQTKPIWRRVRSTCLRAKIECSLHQHSRCANGKYSGRRKRVQNHLLGKTLSRLHCPIRLDSSRIRRQLVSLAREGNGRMVVSGPAQILRKPSQRNLRAGVRQKLVK